MTPEQEIVTQATQWYSWQVITAIICGCIALYLFGLGVFGEIWMAEAKYESDTKNHSDEKREQFKDSTMTLTWFWPLFLPIWVGVKLGEWVVGWAIPQSFTPIKPPKSIPPYGEAPKPPAPDTSKR